jgi:hypothetical protein
MLGAGAAFSTVLTAYRYTNGLRGIASAETDEEEVERRENAKKARRRPLSETIQELGEGRGEQCTAQLIDAATNRARNLRSRLRREEATTTIGEIWHRCEGRTRVELIADALSRLQERKAFSLILEFTPGACTYIIQCLTDLIQTIVLFRLVNQFRRDTTRYSYCILSVC